MSEKKWVTVAVSCAECDIIGVRMFSTKPTEKEEEKVKRNIGGMGCINTHTFELDESMETTVQRSISE